MNWHSIDKELLRHWQRLGQFRRRHPALARGDHKKLASQPYTFMRSYGTDRVVIALGASGSATVSVGTAFGNGVWLRDGYTGRRAQVIDGAVTLEAADVVLLEEAR